MAQGAASHPLWDGSATPLFFFILIYFIFKIKFLKNNILLVKNGAF
jgi:hypothetical protein